MQVAGSMRVDQWAGEGRFLRQGVHRCSFRLTILWERWLCLGVVPKTQDRSRLVFPLFVDGLSSAAARMQVIRGRGHYDHG